MFTRMGNVRGGPALGRNFDLGHTRINLHVRGCICSGRRMHRLGALERGLISGLGCQVVKKGMGKITRVQCA